MTPDQVPNQEPMQANNAVVNATNPNAPSLSLVESNSSQTAPAPVGDTLQQSCETQQWPSNPVRQQNLSNLSFPNKNFF